jgi:outer membrane protein assembly factor BamB
LTSSNDGVLYAVHKTDGTLAWKRRLFSTQIALGAEAGPGVGDAFLVSYTNYDQGQPPGQLGSRLHDLATGEPMGPLLTRSGASVRVTVIGPEGFVGHDEQGGLHLIDHCGETKWSVTSDPDASLRASLVLPDGTVVAAGFTPSETYRVSTYSATGERLAGPVDLGPGGRPMAAGADGVLYALSCSPQGGRDAPPALLMFDRQLKPLGRLELGVEKGQYGYACPQAGVTIGADGVMYLVAGQLAKTPTTQSGALVIAVQTTSPGVPPFGWPLAAHDPRGTNWLDR